MEELLRRLADRGDRAGSHPRLVAFASALALGALVGAAIAGSAIWSKVREDGAEEDLQDAEAAGGLQVDDPRDD